MKQFFFCFLLNFFVFGYALAQTNYVATAPLSATPGGQNVLIGPSSGTSITTGGANVFVGFEPGKANTVGSFNIFVGHNAGYTNSTGFYNTFLGGYAGYLNSTASDNTFLGHGAGYRNATGQYNTFVGRSAGATNTTSYFNTFLGYNAGNTSTGAENTFLGSQAGFGNTTGAYNVFVGFSAGAGLGVGNTGNNNTFVGYTSGAKNTAGIGNTFFGYKAGYNNTTGSNNIIIGPNSGTAITTSDDNVLMGFNSQADDGLWNAIAIGANSRVAASNALILGHQVNVGIGTSAPANRLEVVSQSPNSSGLTLTNLTDTSPAVGSTDQFLTVNKMGEVVKARYALRIDSPSEWSDKVFSPTYHLRSLASVTTYIRQYGHLPEVPSAQQLVNEGISLVKLNATLLEKIEELTLYSIQQQQAHQRLQARVIELEKQRAKVTQLEALIKELIKKK